MPVRQRLLLNQRRGPGCARGDYLSPCNQEELGESQMPAPLAWGHVGSRRLAVRGPLGVPGVLPGPIFPQSLGGITEYFGDLQPSPGSGVSCVCHLVPHVPTSSRHVPPSPWVPRGAHPSRDPGRCPLPVPCLATLCPAALVGICPTSPAPHPAGTPSVCGAPSPGRAPTSLPAPACCPALFPGGKKSNGNSLV